MRPIIPALVLLLASSTTHAETIAGRATVIDADTITWDLWMKGDPEAAAALMKPANEDALVSRSVSKAVGNVKNNSPELLA